MKNKALINAQNAVLNQEQKINGFDRNGSTKAASQTSFDSTFSLANPTMNSKKQLPQPKIFEGKLKTYQLKVTWYHRFCWEDTSKVTFTNLRDFDSILGSCCWIFSNISNVFVCFCLNVSNFHQFCYFVVVKEKEAKMVEGRFRLLSVEE